MAFNGTENFKPGELVSFLETIGARFGPHVNAYTSFDETVYMLDLPTDKPGYVDRGLLVLHDFAAGMSLMDTVDGAFMSVAYGWAFSRPVRKIYYNITVTALSVAVAAIIGVCTLGSMLAENLDVTSGPLAWLADLDLEYVGYGIVALFVVAWVVSVTVWKVGRIEERWSADLG